MFSYLVPGLIVSLGVALLAIAGRARRATKAKARAGTVSGPIGEARLKAYAALLSSGVPAEVAKAALSAQGMDGEGAPLRASSSGETAANPPPVPPSSASPIAVPPGPLPDPHLLERIRALEAKVAALEAQVGAPAAADLQGMRAPRPGDDTAEASRPAGLRAFP